MQPLRNDPTSRKRQQRSRKRHREREKTRYHQQNSNECEAEIGDTSVLSTGQNTTKESVREEGLRNIIHSRAEPVGSSASNLAVKHCMTVLRAQMQNDIQHHKFLIEPDYYVVCRVCGRSSSRKSCRVPKAEDLHKWMRLLDGKVYPDDKNSDALHICAKCATSLSHGTIPISALKRGWPFCNSIPYSLSVLSKYEKQLICLRLPSIYMYRSQGGFGQNACKGAPVSFANPVAELSRKLPRRPRIVFKILLDHQKKVEIDSKKIREALLWLRQNNPLYENVQIDEKAFDEIDLFGSTSTNSSIEATENDSNSLLSSSMRTDFAMNASNGTTPYASQKYAPDDDLREEWKGMQGPIDDEALNELSRHIITGIDDSESPYHAQLLIQHMLRPFIHRHNDMLPSYDAEKYLESYFPVLFPYGNGGPNSIGLHLKSWVKIALSVSCSKFSRDLEFIFFVYCVLRRKRITGLCLHAPIRNSSNQAIMEVRDLLSSSLPAKTVANRIDYLLRCGTLNASFETLKGSPAFWGALRRKAWAYLTRFGPCQVFLTMSAADLTDPYVYCQANPSLTLEAARNLDARQRANILASNPVSAVTIFHRRVKSLLHNFLLGQTKPFGAVVAYLGRIEQQKRFSPHLHLLVWLKKKCPDLSGTKDIDPEDICKFVEMFSTAILPPEIPTPQSNVSAPSQSIPPSAFLPVSSHGTFSPNPLSPEQRYNVLSERCNELAMNGNIENNRKLRALLLATQFHKCKSYCFGREDSCRFLFPFPLQDRGSIATRNISTGEKQFVALAPRTLSSLNSTHPMLTVMSHSNTDVTVITGNSIPESMYVCSYAVKADKHEIFDVQALCRLKRSSCENDDRKLLGSIARHATSSRSVGAQEAVDYLLDNPLSFTSATVLNISTMWLLDYPEALSEDQKRILTTAKYKNRTDILPQLDFDDAAAVHNRYNPYNQDSNLKTSSNVNVFVTNYIRRPLSMEYISATTFHESYVVRKLGKSRVKYDKNMLLLHPSKVDSEILRSTSEFETQIVQRRKLQDNGIGVQNILNIPSRGKANEESPYFAAAALVLHVPFRSANDLLNNRTLTQRLVELLEAGKYPALNQYVTYSQELSIALSRPKSRPHKKSRNILEVHDQNHEDRIDTTEELEHDQEDWDPPIGDTRINEHSMSNPLRIRKEWHGNPIRKLEYTRNTDRLQLEIFRSYLKDCRTIGIRQAERNLQSSSLEIYQLQSSLDDQEGAPQSITVSDEQVQKTPMTITDKTEALELKKRLISEGQTDDQKAWLDFVLSYLYVYYSNESSDIPEALKELCKRNHPIFTNAPGGCGKSWLLKKVEEFVCKCIPFGAQPCWAVSEQTQNVYQGCNDFSMYSDLNPGRLGRVAIFAPSGVAAGNSNGYTFHNGLRSSTISFHTLRTGPSDEVLATLFDDFSAVSVIVIEEYSMTSLLLIAYLDLITRRIRSAYAETFFGGIVVLITGDGLQLPVINSHGLLSSSEKIPGTLQKLHNHLTKEAYFLQLSESVRQKHDPLYADLLLRIRSGTCTEQDAKTLNTRYIDDIEALYQHSSKWRSATILTARNETVNTFNNIETARNGKNLGTFHIHSIPFFIRTKCQESRRKSAKLFYQGRTSFGRTESQFRFKPPPITVIYPQMPVMLRTNICPLLGLCNGTIGIIHSVVEQNGIKAHETDSEVIERCIVGNSIVPSLLIQFPNTYKGCIGALNSLGSGRSQFEARSTVLIEPQVFDGVKGLPIVPAHAITMHKSQSLTIPLVIIDPRETFCMGALYVAFSRSPSLERIVLLSPVSVSILNKYHSHTNNVLSRIKNIEDFSSPTQDFIDFVRSMEEI